MSLPLYNTVEIFVFFIMTILKAALFPTIGTYSGVVYLLNCCGALCYIRLQPSNPGLLRTRERIICVSITTCWVPFSCQHRARSDWAEKRETYVPVSEERFEPGTVLTTLCPFFLPFPVILRSSYYHLHFVSEKTVAEGKQRLAQVSYQVSVSVGTLRPSVCFTSV